MRGRLTTVSLSVIVLLVLLVGFVSAGFFGDLFGNNKLTGKVVDSSFTLTDEFDFWEDQTSHDYVVAGSTSKGAYSCSGESYCTSSPNCGNSSLRLGSGGNGGGGVSLEMDVTQGTDEIILGLNSAWCNGNGGNVFDLTIDGVDFSSSINWELNFCLPANRCKEKEITLSGLSDYTQDGEITIQISDAHPGAWDGDSQLTYLKVYSKEVSGVTPPEPTPTPGCIAEGTTLTTEEIGCLDNVISQLGYGNSQIVRDTCDFDDTEDAPLYGGCSFGELGHAVYQCYLKNFPSEVIPSLEACVEETTTCTDSDSGLDYSEKGELTVDGTVYEDVCMDSNFVTEYFCDNPPSYYDNYYCPNGCQDGACIEGTTPEPTNIPTLSCTASEQNLEVTGLKRDDFFRIENEDTDMTFQIMDAYNHTGGDITKDRVKFIDNSSGITYQAIFTSEGVGEIIIDGRTYLVSFIDDNNEEIITLKKEWCNPVTTATQTTPTCTDSDGGNDINIKGETKGILWDSYPSERIYSEVEDYCIEENDERWFSISSGIAEYFCASGIDDNEDYVNVNGYNCPNGCFDGACLAEGTEIIEPIDDPVDIVDDDGLGVTCLGCVLKNTCLPYGYRFLGEESENLDQSKAFYCSIDGNPKEQRTFDSKGNWASCQNNYECESNICSSGECIEVASLLKEASGFKSLGVRVLCRLAHLFSEENYNECIYNYLG